MNPKWCDLAKTLQSNEYNVEPGDRHYGATAPLAPKPCRCQPPGLVADHDDGEVRCWKCGSIRPSTGAASQL